MVYSRPGVGKDTTFEGDHQLYLAITEQCAHHCCLAKAHVRVAPHTRDTSWYLGSWHGDRLYVTGEAIAQKRRQAAKVGRSVLTHLDGLPASLRLVLLSFSIPNSISSFLRPSASRPGFSTTSLDYARRYDQYQERGIFRTPTSTRQMEVAVVSHTVHHAGHISPDQTWIKPPLVARCTYSRTTSSRYVYK